MTDKIKTSFIVDPTDTDSPAPVSDHGAEGATVLIPASKLDADNYMAEDIDGINENLAGSGNLNYLMLQSRQTDLAALDQGFNPFGSSNADISGGGLSTAAAVQRALDAMGDGNGNGFNAGGAADESGKTGGLFNLNGGDAAAFSAAGDSGAVAANATGNTPPEISDNPENPPEDPESPEDPEDPELPEEPENPDPENPDPEDPETGDVDVDAGTDIGLPDIEINLDPLEDILGDTDVIVDVERTDDGIHIDLDTIGGDIPVNITDLDINVPVVMPVVNSVVDTAVAPILEAISDTANLDDLIRNPVGAALDIADDIMQDPVGAITDTVTNLTEALDVENLLQDPVGTLGGLAEAPLQALTDTVENIFDNILQPDNSASDTDLAFGGLLGIPALNLNLDPVESLLGDIDLGFGLTQGENGTSANIDGVLLGLPIASSLFGSHTPAIDPALGEFAAAGTPVIGNLTEGIDINGILQDPAAALENILGDPQGTADGIAGGLLDGLLNPAADPNDIDLIGNNDIGIDPINQTLDPVESLVGDIDILAGITHGDDGVGASLDSIIATLPLANADVITDAPLVTPIVNAVLDNGDVAGASTPILDGITESLLQPDAAANDTDLTVGNNLGIPAIDQALDPVENIAGDIDAGIGLSVAENGNVTIDLDTVLLGLPVADTAVTFDAPIVTPIIGGILGDTPADENLTGLTGLDDIFSNTDDPDALIGGLGASGENMAESVMTILQELQLTADATSEAEGLLSGIPGDPAGGIFGGEGLSWPEQATGGLGDLGDTISSLIDTPTDMASLLPEPIGNITEGLGILSSGSEGGGALSGLLHGHHGGLFG